MPGKDARYDEYKRKVESEILRRLRKVGIHMEGEVIKIFGDTGIKSKKGATKAQRRANRSAPGEPPHRDTGRLIRSIASEVHPGDFAVHVGASTSQGVAAVPPKPTKKGAKGGRHLAYSIFLELGTSKMAARPYLRPSLDANRQTIARMFGKPLRII